MYLSRLLIQMGKLGGGGQQKQLFLLPCLYLQHSLNLMNKLTVTHRGCACFKSQKLLAASLLVQENGLAYAFQTVLCSPLVLPDAQLVLHRQAPGTASHPGPCSLALRRTRQAAFVHLCWGFCHSSK